MSHHNSSNDMFPLILAAAVMFPFIFMDAPEEPDIIELMSAENAEQAVNKGMQERLSPYFALCQQENGITAGDARNTTLAQAEDTESCLFRKHEEAQAAPRP